MGKPVASLGDSTTGHGCWPPTVLCQSANSIIVQGSTPCRVGDQAVPHICTNEPYPVHGLAVAQGSSSVIYEGMPVARIGDAMTCGDAIAVGKQTIIIGG